MAAESIIDYKKPEFPKIETTESGTITRIEYIGNGVTGVGDAATISAALPAVGDKWGNYAGLVKSVSKEPKENTDILEVFITVEQPKDNTDIDAQRFDQLPSDFGRFGIAAGGVENRLGSGSQRCHFRGAL